MVVWSRVAGIAGMGLGFSLVLAACGGKDELSESASSVVVSWSECAREGGTCSFSGRREVRYTAVTGSRVLTRVAEGGVACADHAFQAAATNYENICLVADVTTEAPLTVGASTSVSTSTPATSTTPAPATSSAPSAVFTTGNAGPRVGSFINSGPINATSGQVIAGVRIQNPGGACINIVGVSNVIVRDSDIGPCGGAAVEVTGGANNVTIEHNAIHNVAHGVRATHATSVNTVNNTIRDIPAASGEYRHAIEYSWMNGGTVQGNVMTGTFPNDVMSGYESNNLRFLDNRFDVTVIEPTGAAFTMGDSTSGKPGSNNYVAGNIVYQRGGVPAGVFGSNGNTVLEKNCLTAGIQAYNYSGVFVGVTVRDNVINIGNSFVPDSSLIGGWSTNINSTDCSLLAR
jgi:hypothetical protein